MTARQRCSSPSTCARCGKPLDVEPEAQFCSYDCLSQATAGADELTCIHGMFHREPCAECEAFNYGSQGSP